MRQRTFIGSLQVPASADAADAEIVERVVAGDIVVTADIPLAALVLEKYGMPLNPRGDWYDRELTRRKSGAKG